MNSQKAYEKVLNTISHQENKIENHDGYHYVPTTMAKAKKTDHSER